MVYKLDGTQGNSGTAPADADLVPFYDDSATDSGDPTDKIADMNMAQLAAYVATKTGFGGLNNMDATDDPDANDDTGSGYEIGSMWYNQTSNALFVAESVGAAAASWTNVSATVTEKVLEDLWSAAATPILASGDKFPFADVSGTDTLGTATAPDICSTGGALLKDGTTDLTGDLVINERADHADTPTAGKGQVWVRSDTPNVLVYTDDAGTDTVLGSGGTRITTTTDPGVNDDGAGTNGTVHVVNDLWTNTTTDTSWICQDITATAAVWAQIDLPGLLTGLSTGVVNGGVLSVGTPNTTFTISDGSGYVIDTTYTAPTITEVTWTGETNLTVTNLATNLITFVSIDNAGAVVQRTTRPTSTQQRSEIFLGVVVHVDKTIVDTVNNQQQPAGNIGAQLRSLADSIGFFNINGNVFSANGANLNIDKTEGDIFAAGSNYENDVEDPHALTLSSLTALSFQYRFLDGTNGVTGTAIDPNIYDLAGTSTAVPTNKFTVQRIYSFTSNNVKIQPGQVIYNNLDDAKAAISTEAFTTEPSIVANGLLRGFLVVQEGTTDLSNATTTEFLEAGKFGESNGGGAGGGGGDLWTDPLDSDIIPDTTNTYDLGSAAARFAECHVTTLDVNGNITLLGTVDGRDVAADGAILDSITPTSKYETAVASDFPDATDDSLGVFALWIHTTDQRAWICVDDTAATAVWLELATGAGDAWGDVVDAVITPDADGTRDLGLTGTRFATAYVDDLDVTTNIVVGGTVDGRDVAADGTALDALEGVNHTESAGPPLATWDSDDATGDLVAHTVGDTHYDTATQLVYTCEDATATAAVWYAKNRRVVHFFSVAGKLTNVMAQTCAGVFTVPGVISKIVFNTLTFTALDASNYWEFDFVLNNDNTNFILAAPKDMNSSQNINQFGSYDMGAMTATTAYKTVAVGDTLKVDWQAGAGTPASLGSSIQGYTVWVDTAIV